MADEDQERELPEFDGTRPQEQADASECEGSPKRCEFQPHELAGGVEESEFEAGEEIHESFPVEQIPVVLEEDGRATILTPDHEDALAVPFCYETQLCIEDEREYVELFTEELWERGWTARERSGSTALEYGYRNSSPQLALTVRERYDKSTGKPNQRRTFCPDQVERRWNTDLVKESPLTWLPVRPKRERCRFYQRQVFSNDNQKDPAKPGHQLVFRVCTARRSNGGAYMSLRDEGIYACDFRDPPDAESAALQDAKDRKKVEERPDLLLLPLFNIDGETIQLERSTDADDYSR